MKILLIGASSSLGTALLPVLREFAEVITAGRKNCDITLDLADTNNSSRLPKEIDAVINTAAHFGGATDEDFAEAVKVNVAGALSLLSMCKEAGCKYFLQISSCYALLTEGATYYSIYSVTKRHADEITALYCRANGIPLAILRPSQIYGADDSFRRHQPFIYVMADHAEKGEDITIYGANDAKRNYIYIDDLAAVVARTVQQGITGIYSCTYPEDVAMSQIAGAAFAAFDKGGKIVFLKDKPDIPDNVFSLDYSLYEKINYFPCTSIEQGMRKISDLRKAST